MITYIIIFTIVFVAGFNFAFKVYAVLFRSAGNMVIGPIKGLIQGLGVSNNTSIPESTTSQTKKSSGLTINTLLMFGLIMVLGYHSVTPYLDTFMNDLNGQEESSNRSSSNNGALVSLTANSPISDRNNRRPTKKVNRKPSEIKSNAAYNDQKRLKKAENLVLVLANKNYADDLNLDESNDPLEYQKENEAQYFLKIGAYGDYSNLEESSRRLSEYDLTPIIQDIEVNGSIMYRLYIGTFVNKGANNWLAYLKQEGWDAIKISETKVKSDGKLYLLANENSLTF